MGRRETTCPRMKRMGQIKRERDDREREGGEKERQIKERRKKEGR